MFALAPMALPSRLISMRVPYKAQKIRGAVNNRYSLSITVLYNMSMAFFSTCALLVP